MKGLVLATTIYGDVTERPFEDVDALVQRRDFDRALAVVEGLATRVLYLSREMGELTFEARGIQLELHAEIGRPHLTSLSTEDVLARGRPDATFSVPTRAVRDDDHALLLVANVIKDHFASNERHAVDLIRLLPAISPETLAARCRDARFTTATSAVIDWLVELHGAQGLEDLRHALAPPRSTYLRALELLSRSRVPPAIGLAIACAANDDPAERLASLSVLARRGISRALGRDPG